MLHQPASTFQPTAIKPPAPCEEALLALGVELEAAAAAVDAADVRVESEDTAENWEMLSAAHNAENVIIEKIEAHPASTLASLRVKARALSRCHSDEPVDDYFFSDDPTTDVRLAAGILRDLLSLPAPTAPVAL